MISFEAQIKERMSDWWVVICSGDNDDECVMRLSSLSSSSSSSSSSLSRASPGLQLSCLHKSPPYSADLCTSPMLAGCRPESTVYSQLNIGLPLGRFLSLLVINVKNEVYKNGYRRRSCTSKTAKIHRFVRFVMYCSITTLPVAFYWACSDDSEGRYYSFTLMFSLVLQHCCYVCRFFALWWRLSVRK